MGGSESGGESEPGSLFRWELGERERAEVGSGKGSTRLSLPRRVERDGWLVTTTHTEKHTPSHRLQGDRYLGLFHFLQSTAKLLTERESSMNFFTLNIRSWIVVCDHRDHLHNTT